MFLRDIAVYADKTVVESFPDDFQWFHRESCCVTDMFVSLIERMVATKDTVKVNFVFCDDRDQSPSERQLLNVADVRWPFDFSHYFRVAHQHKKKSLLLAELHSAVIWLAQRRGWDETPLTAAHDECLSRGLSYEGWSKKQWPSPDKTHKGRIYFVYELRMVQLFLCVFVKRREIGRKLLGKTIPECGILNQLIEKGEWVSRSTFRLAIRPVHFHLSEAWEVDVSDILSRD